MRPMDTGAIQPVLPVQDDGGDVHEQGWIEARLPRVPGAEHPIDLGDFPCQLTMAARIRTTQLAVPICCWNIPRITMTPLAIGHMARQGIQLLAFEQSAPAPIAASADRSKALLLQHSRILSDVSEQSSFHTVSCEVRPGLTASRRWHR